MSSMINAKHLLDRFLGPGGAASALEKFSGGGAGASPAASPWLNPAGAAGGGMAEAAKRALGGQGGVGSLAMGGAAGSLLGLLVGGKKKGRLGGALSHGGAAMLGALASRAYENWQQGKAPSQAPVAAPQEAERVPQKFLPAAAAGSDGQPFELSLIRAMIAAAKADGHIDEAERRLIFERVGQMGLDAEGKAFVFDALAGNAGVSEIAALAATPEQASEIYLASRLAVDTTQPEERAWLEALAGRLRLPEGLAAHLDRQVEAA
ncbi:tellurite resistance TerB family protein [Roseomonas sp. USHLN139]|uniref:tellurite resistance TerB family protein n=1 Tax=Roseomonas sp. USHLN139 TaxID=3081298 RepID=UPI003B022130